MTCLHFDCLHHIIFSVSYTRGQEAFKEVASKWHGADCILEALTEVVQTAADVENVKQNWWELLWVRFIHQHSNKIKAIFSHRTRERSIWRWPSFDMPTSCRNLLDLQAEEAYQAARLEAERKALAIAMAEDAARKAAERPLVELTSQELRDRYKASSILREVSPLAKPWMWHQCECIWKKSAFIRTHDSLLDIVAGVLKTDISMSKSLPHLNAALLLILN